MAKRTIPKGMSPLKETALRVGYCVLHLQRLCKANKVPHTRRSHDYFFSPADEAAILGRSSGVEVVVNEDDHTGDK
jgi:hypothetical protein